MKEHRLKYINNTIEMNYLLYVPDDLTSNMPLLVYLHGAGERGLNIEHLYRHGIAELMKNGLNLNAFVLCPQCPAMFVWDNVISDLKQLIDNVIEIYKIDKTRISLTGSSMGGFGSFMMGVTYPNFFSSIAPVAGGGMSWRASKLITTPLFVVHGTSDDTVPIEYSTMMVNVVRNCGGTVKFIELENYGHNDGIDYAYNNTELIEFLLNSKRMDFSEVNEICYDMF